MEHRIPEPSLPEDDLPPATEPKADLLPPPRLPPTAVSAAAGPEPRPPRPVRAWSPPPERARRRPWLFRVLNGALDLLDGVAEELRTVGKSFAGGTKARGLPNG